MSTITSIALHQDDLRESDFRPDEIDCSQDLHALLCGLEANLSLFKPERLRERLAALDDLDAGFGGFEAQIVASQTTSRLHRRAKALQVELEGVNAALYQSIRSEMVSGGHPRRLLQWLPAQSPHGSESPSPGLGFDFRDELVSGVLQLCEPSAPSLPRFPEMVPYQPTPARHILHLIKASALSDDDLLVDLGSGLGHVPLLVSRLSGARSLGIEVQPAYVVSAQKCAQSLRLSRVRFISEDARRADLSTGTVFYLYSPFTGSILTGVLSALRRESARRSIKICSLGPCTRILANQSWLKASAVPDPERVTVFESR
jgi:hypothetical protein